MVVTGLRTAVLLIGFWLWFRPPTLDNRLDPNTVAEVLKPVLIEATKTDIVDLELPRFRGRLMT